MAYNIVKLENGNVALYDSGSGDFLKSISPDYVEIECNVNGVVKLIQDNGNVEYFLPADVANTQILPAAAVPFAGTCADLAELLATDFFFEVAGGGSVEYTYDNTNYTDFVSGPFTPTSTAVQVDTIQWTQIVIKEDRQILDILIGITAGVAGNSVFGIYDSLNGLPNNLLFQSTAFDNSITGTQIYTLPAAYSIKKGIYFIAYLSSSAATLRTIPASALYTFLSTAGAGNNSTTAIRKTLTYTSTLPANYTDVVSAATFGYYVCPRLMFKLV